MKIAYIFADRNVAVTGCGAGSSIHLQEMCRAIADLGHEVIVLAGKAGDRKLPGIARVYQLLPNMQWSGSFKRHTQVNYASLSTTGTLAPIWNANVLLNDVLRVSWTALWDTYFYHAAKPVIRAEEPDILYERYACQSTAGEKLARHFQLPLVSEINGSYTFQDQWWHRHTPLYTWLVRRTERTHVAATDQLVAISSQLKNYLVRIGAPENKIAIVPDGADPERFRPDPDCRRSMRQSLGFSSETVVGFVGSLRRFHELGTVLDSLEVVIREEPEVRLLIIGDGPERQSLEARVHAKGLQSHVMLVGHVAREFVPRYIRCMDIALATFPAEHDYSSPLKLFEYMASAKAIIASRCGIDNAITAEEGVLVNSGDADGLARAILFLSRNPEVRDRLGNRAREKLVQQFTWAKNAAKVVDLFRELQSAHSSKESCGTSP